MNKFLVLLARWSPSHRKYFNSVWIWPESLHLDWHQQAWRQIQPGDLNKGMKPETITLPETNTSPLKIDPCKRRLVLETTIFRGKLAVSFREGIYFWNRLLFDSSFSAFKFNSWDVRGEMHQLWDARKPPQWNDPQDRGLYGKNLLVSRYYKMNINYQL